MYQGCPNIQDQGVKAALAYFAVAGTQSSLTMRHVCASVEELRAKGIIDLVLLPCFAAVLGKERSFVSLLEMAQGGQARDAFLAECSDELRQEARTVITGVVNLQIGQAAISDSPLCTLCRARRRGPRLDPVELRRTLETMYDVRHDPDHLRAIHDDFVQRH